MMRMTECYFSSSCGWSSSSSCWCWWLATTILPISFFPACLPTRFVLGPERRPSPTRDTAVVTSGTQILPRRTWLDHDTPRKRLLRTLVRLVRPLVPRPRAGPLGPQTPRAIAPRARDLNPRSDTDQRPRPRRPCWRRWGDNWGAEWNRMEWNGVGWV